jgi:hypothetical protein
MRWHDFGVTTNCFEPLGGRNALKTITADNSRRFDLEYPRIVCWDTQKAVQDDMELKRSTMVLNLVPQRWKNASVQ